MLSVQYICTSSDKLIKVLELVERQERGRAGYPEDFCGTPSQLVQPIMNSVAVNGMEAA